VSYSKYRVQHKTCHFLGHATINVTTAGGFGLSLPIATPYRSFSLSQITLHGASGYTDLFGDGHVPGISAPYNRFGPVANNNATRNIVASGDTVHWNVMYETV
jgi:hypothetical protein